MIDWGFDLPDGLDGLGDHSFDFDIDHDGISESMGGVLDIDHDGISESMGGVIDLDHDGISEGSMGLDHVDPFLSVDYAGVEPSALTSAVSSMHFPDPFAGPVAP